MGRCGSSVCLRLSLGSKLDYGQSQVLARRLLRLIGLPYSQASFLVLGKLANGVPWYTVLVNEPRNSVPINRSEPNEKTSLQHYTPRRRAYLGLLNF